MNWGEKLAADHRVAPLLFFGPDRRQSDWPTVRALCGRQAALSGNMSTACRKSFIIKKMWVIQNLIYDF
jgi:hypothetical protein